MATIDDVIGRLNDLKASSPDGGATRVVVRCQVPDIDGWLATPNIRLVPEPDQNNNRYVRIEGGFGA